MRTTQQEEKNEKTTEQENVIGKEAGHNLPVYVCACIVCTLEILPTFSFL